MNIGIDFGEAGFKDQVIGKREDWFELKEYSILP